MIKFRIINKNQERILRVKTPKGQQLNIHDAEILAKGKSLALIVGRTFPKGKAFRIEYDITGYISLAEYLIMPVNKARFAALLYQIHTKLCGLQNLHFNLDSIILSLEMVFVDPSAHTVSFLYLPLQYFEGGISLKQFYLNIAYRAVFTADESNDYINEYLAILNDGLNFSEFEMEQYIAGISGKQIAGKPGNEEVSYRSGTVSLGTEIKNSGYDPLAAGGGKTGVMGGPDLARPAAFGSSTTVLGAGDTGGSLVQPYLLREKNREKIYINKASFRIGKEKQFVDFCIADNTAISGSHADIVTRGGRYFLIDRNSTNKTKVNGCILAPEQEYEISPGSKICLANEDFTFYI